jgi:hypothetical protein
MNRAEFIQELVIRGGMGRDGAEGLIDLAVKRADALEKSGVAPWGQPSEPGQVRVVYEPELPQQPETLKPTTTGGERACAIFFKSFGQREYTWADLPELERRAWEEVAGTLTGRGKAAVDIIGREREACAAVVEAMIAKSDLSQRQFLVYMASQIRARR